MPAASPSHSAGTMARSTVVPRRPARFPSLCAGPARILPQLHRSFERGFTSSLSFFLTCPSERRISNELACFEVSIGTKLKGRVIITFLPHFDFPERRKWLRCPSSCADWSRLPSADFLVTSRGAGAEPLLWILNFVRQKSARNCLIGGLHHLDDHI